MLSDKYKYIVKKLNDYFSNRAKSALSSQSEIAFFNDVLNTLSEFYAQTVIHISAIKQASNSNLIVKLMNENGKLKMALQLHGMTTEGIEKILSYSKNTLLNYLEAKKYLPEYGYQLQKDAEIIWQLNRIDYDNICFYEAMLNQWHLNVKKGLLSNEKLNEYKNLYVQANKHLKSWLYIIELYILDDRSPTILFEKEIKEWLSERWDFPEHSPWEKILETEIKNIA